jgi:thiamine-phosphate diphosphorylase
MSRLELDLSLYLVIGRENVPGKTTAEVLRVIEEAMRGGVGVVQLREKTTSDDELLFLVSEVSELIAQTAETGHRVGLLINDRVDIALEARNAGLLVDGVHLGQKDMHPLQARQLLGDDAIVGLTAGRTDLVEVANELPPRTIDYIGAGPLRATSSKPDAGVYNGQQTILGVQGIGEVARLAKVPVIAGGGVTPDDVLPLLNAGASGVFVINYICGAADPRSATRELRSALQKRTVL